MIDRTVLRQMGFRQVGPSTESYGWAQEVWHFESGGDCWVIYGSPQEEYMLRGYLPLRAGITIEEGHSRTIVHGESCLMEEFFALFLRHYANCVFHGCHIQRGRL